MGEDLGTPHAKGEFSSDPALFIGGSLSSFDSSGSELAPI
jgi:hypothetical protein